MPDAAAENGDDTTKTTQSASDLDAVSVDDLTAGDSAGDGSAGPDDAAANKMSANASQSNTGDDMPSESSAALNPLATDLTPSLAATAPTMTPPPEPDDVSDDDDSEEDATVDDKCGSGNNGMENGNEGATHSAITVTETVTVQEGEETGASHAQGRWERHHRHRWGWRNE